ncbi:hypothetical protein P280DRAFT_472157 [Massarina eburnea CBS 473.64]|uniref:Uncharacterized protein n=1 Tax=Massarina eburnea CBS 473.64 TaxID=1395130 RepID=A0A6A6RQP7_9PLEO|nr:hypothetical protein P280DRAFT_472157 [Massarina eburnea CBS 473.64]
MARTVQWQHDSSSRSTTTSGRSGSERSYETAPSDYDSPSAIPPLPRHETCLGRVERHGQDYFAPVVDERAVAHTARSSVETYASTSAEDVADDFDDMPEYAVPHYHHEPLPHDAIPTTSRDFADLFPTSKRISIRHDDSTIDGNMNLRVDTQVEDYHHKKQNYTLFHLRMHDLRTREFSLRRYCRESGREVCHSIRKYKTPTSEKRPVLQRASTALAGLMMHKPDSRPNTAVGLKRSDSGYASIHSATDDRDSRPKTAGCTAGHALMPTNTVKLEFSNYAHLDVKRRGAKSGKRYAFEYWGYDYSWKRFVSKEHDLESVAYYLVRSDDEKLPLAHISPVRLTHDQAREEAARGGWIPPCYMRITDEVILKANSDLSDIVVATGLMALVDDCIKRKFHSKQATQLHIPLLRTKMHIDYVGPKRLIDEVFHRRSSGPPSRHPSALRRAATQS